MTRLLLLGTAIGTVVLVAAWLQPGPPETPHEAPAPSPVNAPAALYRVASPAVASVAAAAVDAKLAAPPAAAPAAPTEDLFPFRFLGRVGEGVVLFANGRVLTVQAPGPLDDSYAVDEIHDDGLVLRHVRLNVTKTLAFVSQQVTAVPARPPEDLPQD